MSNFTGTIIEESLEDKSLLNGFKITSTKVEDVVEKHKTPWIKTWTLHKVEIEESEAEKVAEQLSKSLDREHVQSWYTDFKSEEMHYIIFRDKVFKVDRTKREEYEEAMRYGLALGLPEYQLGFVKFLKTK